MEKGRKKKKHLLGEARGMKEHLPQFPAFASRKSTPSQRSRERLAHGRKSTGRKRKKKKKDLEGGKERRVRN